MIFWCVLTLKRAPQFLNLNCSKKIVNFLVLRQNKLDYKILVRLAVVAIDLTYNGHIFHLEYKRFVLKQN